MGFFFTIFLLIVAAVAAFLYWYFEVHEPCDTSEYITFHNAPLEKKFSKHRIPMTTLYEAYFNGDLDLKGDMREVLLKRRNFVSFKFTWENIKFVIFNFLPETLIHSRAQDESQVRWHYDRGNDFFEAFLGDTMVYTCAHFTKDNIWDLETAQVRKIHAVANKCQMKAGMKHLDIGCGWGSMVRLAARDFKTKSTGVTISRNQIEYASKRCEAEKIGSNWNFLCMDYRDIPKAKYNVITCLEMAEHVGVRLFKKFCRQVYDLLEDDGLFVIQVSGLRRATQMEDLIWGLFMAKYIFPGADASTPLSFYVDMLEKAGWELRSIETIGVHYAVTIRCWYRNWLENQESVINTYGRRWYRIWEVFLAWSAIVPAQGSATCYQMLCNKNINEFDRYQFFIPNHDEKLVYMNEEPITEPARDFFYL